MRGEDTYDTRSHRRSSEQLWVGSTEIGRYNREGLITGGHEKAPVCCQCGRKLSSMPLTECLAFCDALRYVTW